MIGDVITTSGGCIVSFAQYDEYLRQVYLFGEICLVIGFVLGIVVPRIAAYLKVKYGRFE